MYNLTKGLGLKWHVYFLTNQFDKKKPIFDYISNWTSSQVEQIMTTLVKMASRTSNQVGHKKWYF